MKRVTFRKDGRVKFVNEYGIHPSILIPCVKLVYGDGSYIIEKKADGSIILNGEIVRVDKLGWCGVCVKGWLICGYKEHVLYPKKESQKESSQ